MRWGYLVKRRIDHFEMGGKIGIETLLDNEKFFLAELIAYSITRHGSCDILRKNSDLRMDWPTTLEMCLLHYFIWQDRLIQFDLDGELFMEEVFIRVYMNLNLRRKEFEKAFQVALPEKKAMGAFANKSQQWQRYIAYQKGFEGSDMELAEALWTYLAPSEDFEIEDEEDEESSANQLIIDRYFNPEGIEYLVHYVRKNIKLLDEKSFLDFKLCTNLVDTSQEQILQHQRHFREFCFQFSLPESDPLKSNREKLEQMLEFDYGQKQNMSWLQRIGVLSYSPSEKFEQELAEDLNKLTAEQLEQFMASKDRLNLFDQTSSEYKRKSGRIFKVD